MLEDLEKMKKMKNEERRQWALGAKLEFEDWQHKDDAWPAANGMLLAMLSKRMQSKIYHEPREGSWWAENPDVKGPRAEGVRPCSAKFVREKEFGFEDDPAIIVDRGMADVMTEVDRVRLRAKRGLNKAKRTIKSAKGMRENADKGGKWTTRIVDVSVKTRVKRALRIAPEEPKDVQIQSSDMVDNQKNFLALMRKSGRAGRGERIVYDPGNKVADEEIEIMEGGGKVGNALGRGRRTIRSPPKRRPQSGGGGNQDDGGGGGRGGLARPVSAGLRLVGKLKEAGGGRPVSAGQRLAGKLKEAGGGRRPKSALPKLRE